MNFPSVPLLRERRRRQGEMGTDGKFPSFLEYENREPNEPRQTGFRKRSVCARCGQGRRTAGGDKLRPYMGKEAIANLKFEISQAQMAERRSAESQSEPLYPSLGLPAGRQARDDNVNATTSESRPTRRRTPVSGVLGSDRRTPRGQRRRIPHYVRDDNFDSTSDCGLSRTGTPACPAVKSGKKRTGRSACPTEGAEVH